MAGTAQRDRSGRDTSGSPSRSQHTQRDWPVRRNPVGGAIARSGIESGRRAGDRIRGLREHDWHGAGNLQQRPDDRAARGQDDVRRERDQFSRVSPRRIGISRAPAIVDLQVAVTLAARGRGWVVRFVPYAVISG
jgi:hypothetical protein